MPSRSRRTRAGAAIRSGRDPRPCERGSLPCGISPSAANRLVRWRKRRKGIGRLRELQALEGIGKPDREKLFRRGLTTQETRFAIHDVRPWKDYLWSSRPIDLRVDVSIPADREIVLVSMQVPRRSPAAKLDPRSKGASLR